MPTRLRILTLFCVLALASCTPAYNGAGTVVSHSYTVEHTTTMVIMCGKTPCVIPVHHDEKWEIIVSIDAPEETTNFSLTEESWESIEDGAIVVIENGAIVSYSNP